MRVNHRNLARVLHLVLGLTVAVGYATLLSCCATENAKDANPDRVVQSYSASYDETTDKTTVRAQFIFGSTTLHLDGGSEVTHDSYALSEHDVLGTFYSGDGVGLKKKNTFYFTDTKGRKYENSGVIEKIEFANSTPTELKRTSPVHVSWAGKPLEQGQKVTLTIPDARDPAKMTSFYASNPGDKFVTLTPSDLSTLSPGDTTMTLTLEKTTPLSQATSAGGNFVTSYHTKDRPIKITD